MSVSLNNYGVSIISPNVKRFMVGKYNYFSLPNLSTYKIKLINNHTTRCDAYVKIDGEDVGAWRIAPFDSITIERPANINRKFVFIKENSYIAEHAGVERYDSNNGLITVVFKPELKRLCPYQYGDDGYISTPTFYDELRYGSDQTLFKPLSNEALTEPPYFNSTGGNTNQLHIDRNDGIQTNFSSGATILGGATDQNFNMSARIYEYDTDNITQINARLIIAPKPKKQFPYVSVRKGMKQYPYHHRDFENKNYVPINQLTERYYNSDRALIERPYFT